MTEDEMKAILKALREALGEDVEIQVAEVGEDGEIELVDIGKDEEDLH